MTPENCELAKGLVPEVYVAQGRQAVSKHERLVKTLLSQRRLPREGWDEATVEYFLQSAAQMDSNNFVDGAGVGEREARVASGLVARRHFRLAHGVGRSGDLAAHQPKAAGSSLLARLTNLLAADALGLAGMAGVGAVSVLPLATGMALALTLQALRAARPPGARYVLWPRIDQKTCLKAIVAAGLEPVVVENVLVGDELRTDMTALTAHLARLGPEHIVCIVTTTSCFAPRGPDSLVEVAKLCAAEGVGHVVNNAYGVQCAALCSLVAAAWRRGRVDAVVQSTDKNFMVPVGGALVAAARGADTLVAAVNALYPGRASAGPMLDLLITLLEWGANGWRAALAGRQALFSHAHARLSAFAAANGERVLVNPHNPISLGLTLDTLGPGSASSWPPEYCLGGVTEPAAGSWPKSSGLASLSGTCAGVLPPSALQSASARPTSLHKAEALGVSEVAPKTYVGAESELAQGCENVCQPDFVEVLGAISSSRCTAAHVEEEAKQAARAITFLGSMLFQRSVSGTRVVARHSKAQRVGGIEFKNYGAHCDNYPHSYLTCAAALGTTERDFDRFLERLEACLKKCKQMR